MVKNSSLTSKANKRPYQGQQAEILAQNIRKPRKLVKNENSFQFYQTKVDPKIPLNFYQTIEQIPTHKLTTAQMQGDPIQLLNFLEKQFSMYGAVKLIAADSWNCPFTFKYVDKEITTRIQCLQDLRQGKPFEQKVRAYRIEAYQAMALKATNEYKYRTNPSGRTQQSKREHEYWNLITQQANEKKPVTVQYAADLSTSSYGSGFPVKKVHNWIDSDFVYQSNLFNLNNISRSPSSLLSITQKRKQKISGISYPWLYMGMQFSTFCWHVEDMFLNSLNYNHKGATKTWYVVPGVYKEKFDQYVRTKFSGSLRKKNLLDKIVLMIDPQELLKQGIQVYKANQRPRQYICTFYKAFHAGFSHGFNVGEAVNFISPKSLAYMDQAQKQYLQLQKNDQIKPKAWVLSQDWLIHENVQQQKLKNFTKQTKKYILEKYQKIIQNQSGYLKQQLIKKRKINYINKKSGINIISQQNKYQKLSCKYCKNYIYLSAIECKNCGILCENHIQNCQCILKPNQFELIVRQPNKDRLKTFDKYPIFMKALQQFKQSKAKENKRSQSLDNYNQKIKKFQNKQGQQIIKAKRGRKPKNVKII